MKKMIATLALVPMIALATMGAAKVTNSKSCSETFAVTPDPLKCSEPTKIAEGFDPCHKVDPEITKRHQMHMGAVFNYALRELLTVARLDGKMGAGARCLAPYASVVHSMPDGRAASLGGCLTGAKGEFVIKKLKVENMGTKSQIFVPNDGKTYTDEVLRGSECWLHYYVYDPKNVSNGNPNDVQHGCVKFTCW